MLRSLLRKCKDLLLESLKKTTFCSCILALALCGCANENAVQSKAPSEQQAPRHERAKTSTVASHEVKTCKGWGDNHSCENPCIEGSIYCAEHAYCSYDGCGKKLSDGEMAYCKEHCTVVLAEWYKRYLEREEERAGIKKETETSTGSGQSNTKRKKNNSYSGKTYGSSSRNSGSYKSYDSGYEDVYDGDYDDKRYKTDPEYANGVDDAMDELGDDW